MYMPFIRRSDEIWRELESISGRKLFLQSGGLIIAPETDSASFHVQGNFVKLSVDMAEKYGIPYQVLNAEKIKQRFPFLMPRPVDRAYYEPGAGVLRPELCIQAQLELALLGGCAIQSKETVNDFRRGFKQCRGSYRQGQIPGRQANSVHGRLDHGPAATGESRWLWCVSSGDLLVRSGRH